MLNFVSKKKIKNLKICRERECNKLAINCSFFFFKFILNCKVVLSKYALLLLFDLLIISYIIINNNK
jgi:hypothetical protein